MAYFYISFATDEDGFRGATVVQAADAKGAVYEATTRGLNPGGEVAMIQIPPEAESEPKMLAMLNRLVGCEEMMAEQGGKRLADMDDDMQSRFRSAAEVVCDECNPVQFIPPTR